MIPKVQEKLGTKVHFDNSLLKLHVYPFESNSTLEVVRWLQGIALANELHLDISQDLVILKGKDFARHSVVLQGKLEDKFFETASQMQWDVFPIGGAYVIEYPVAHQKLIETIQSVPRDPYQFEVNITLLDLDDDEAKGIRTSNLIQLTASNFEILHDNEFSISTSLPGISLSHKQIKYLQDNTINMSLTCIGGEQVVQRIDKTNSIITTSRDTFGQTTSQSVTQFTSGFIFKLTSYPALDKVLVHVDIEMSSDTQKNPNSLPEISRKQVVNSGLLQVDQVWTCAQFESKDLQTENGTRYLLPFRSKQSKSQTLLVTIKRIS